MSILRLGSFVVSDRVYSTDQPKARSIFGNNSGIERKVVGGNGLGRKIYFEGSEWQGTKCLVGIVVGECREVERNVTMWNALVDNETQSQ